MRKAIIALVILILGMAFFLPVALATTDTIGDTSSGGGGGSGSARCWPITASASGDLDSVGINFNDGGHGVYRTAIYSDNSSSPQTLLGQSISASTASGWNDNSVTGVSIVSSTNYWLCEQTSIDSDMYYYGTGTLAYIPTMSYGPFPSTWTGTIYGTTANANMRMIYTATTTTTTSTTTTTTTSTTTTTTLPPTTTTSTTTSTTTTTTTSPTTTTLPTTTTTSLPVTTTTYAPNIVTDVFGSQLFLALLTVLGIDAMWIAAYLQKKYYSISSGFSFGKKKTEEKNDRKVKMPFIPFLMTLFMLFVFVMSSPGLDPIYSIILVFIVAGLTVSVFNELFFGKYGSTDKIFLSYLVFFLVAFSFINTSVSSAFSGSVARPSAPDCTISPWILDLSIAKIDFSWLGNPLQYLYCSILYVWNLITSIFNFGSSIGIVDMFLVVPMLIIAIFKLTEVIKI